jgi:hypothetical protein
MNRCLAFLLALVFASITVSSACVAAPPDLLQFTLVSQRGATEIMASFHDEHRARNQHEWSSGFLPSQLIGLDVSGFHGAGNHPLGFAVVREAGRLDCSGQGGNGRASGNCRFRPDPAFAQLLVSRGIGRPTRDQALSLTALDVRRDLIDAVAAAHYPTPTIDQLMSMTAVGVDGRYIADLARAGYRPQKIDTLVQLRAVGVTPEWIGGFARIGYANVPAEELMQLRALNITPDYISGFDRIGYRHLPVDTLVELKALDITPDFVRSAVGPGKTLPPVSQLMDLKMFGRRR